MAEEKKGKKAEEYTRPWPTAKRADEHFGGDSAEVPVEADGKKVATLRVEKAPNHNPIIVRLEADVPVTVTPEGVYVGKKPVRAGKADGKFEDSAFSHNDVVIRGRDRVDVTFAPITDEKDRRKADAHLRVFKFDGREARVTDRGGMPRTYWLESGQTLHLNLQLPETRIDGEERRLTPIKPEEAAVRAEYRPRRPGVVEGEFNPEMNTVTLPDGTKIFMQEGARVKVSYDVAGKKVDVLDYQATGQKHHARTADAEKALKELPAQMEAARKEVEAGQAALKALREKKAKAGMSEFDIDRDKEVREAEDRYFKKLDPFVRMRETLESAQYGPQAAIGEAGAAVAAATGRVRAELAEDVRERTAGTKESNDASAAVLKKLADPAYSPAGKTSEKRGHDLEVSEGEHATVVTPAYKKAAIAISRGQLVTQPEEVDAIKMRGALAKGVFWMRDVPEPPAGEKAKNGVVVIDNAKGEEVTLFMPGDGGEVKLRRPLHVIARGPVTLDLTHGAPDQYTGQKVTFSAMDAKGKPGPITVKVEKRVQFAFFNRGDALSPNDRYLEGLITDKDGKVTGFQVGKDGPVIRLEPGQKLVLKVDKTVYKARKNAFAAGDTIFTHPEHEFTITGGTPQREMIEDLKKQHEKEEKAKPTQEMDPPAPMPQKLASLPEKLRQPGLGEDLG